MSTHPKPKFNVNLSALRRHYYLDQYVIIAPGRNNRPHGFTNLATPHVVVNAACPFCLDGEPTILAVPNLEHWRVRVVANAYPAVSLTNPNAYGAMEVVIESPDHTQEFSSLSVSHIETILRVYTERIASLSILPGIRYVLAFKNDGPLAGTSVTHTHSQIMALPLMPPRIEAEHVALSSYQDKHGTCAVCDLGCWEVEQNQRLITADSELLTIAPYASTHPYEAWFITKRHTTRLADLTAGELRRLATSLKYVTERLDRDLISFNFFVQEALPGDNHHLIIKLEPRVPMFYGGGEMATGIIINTIAPETVPHWYNETI
ncbi:DUF4931 domain-containing protein [Candidatus Saccharibacteria bacterium]|nr:DUF4931 domain-containing protein [Candidatus Saccharibacteria bacterium]